MRFALALLGLFLSNQALSASFDCDKANSRVEKEICEDRRLSKMDSQLSDLYNRLYTYQTAETQPQFRQQQLNWLKLRDEQCQLATNARVCLKEIYQSRLKSLNEEQGFLQNNLEQQAPQLLQFLTQSPSFEMLEYPKYLPITDQQFIIAIDWGQAGKVGHGLYFADLQSGELVKLVPGLPDFHGIYTDQQRAVIVINQQQEKSGIIKEKLLAVVINEGIYSKHTITEAKHYKKDRYNGDLCYDPMNDSVLGRLTNVSKIQQINIVDVDKDLLRDVTVSLTSKNCQNGETEDATFGLVSAVEPVEEAPAAEPQAEPAATADNTPPIEAAQPINQQPAAPVPATEVEVEAAEIEAAPIQSEQPETLTP